MKIALACDHAGYELKLLLKDYLEKKGHKITDLGAFSPDSSDYPDFAHPLAEAIEQKKCDVGFSMCGSGNGISITANKHANIRSALCWNKEVARLARQHNDANICALPSRFILPELAIEIIDVFLSTEFEGGRHKRRIDKIPIKK